MIKHIEHKNLIPWRYYYVHNTKLKEKIRNEDVEILQWNGTNWNLKLAIISSLLLSQACYYLKQNLSGYRRSSASRFKLI